MNDENTELATKKSSATPRLMIVVICLLVFLVVGVLNLGIRCYGDSKIGKTRTVIQSVKTGIVLEIANRGAMPSLTYDGLCAAFARTTALAELKSLKAIDEQRKCFIDAWGHPLSIMDGELHSVVVVSPGKDGLLGTKDDIR